MLRLFPVMWSHDELGEGHTCCYAHQHPIERNEQCPLDEPVLFTPETREQVDIHVKEVSKDQVDRTDVE